MNLNKELPKEIREACNKLREGAAELDKALHVPRETPDEIKKIKDENACLLASTIVFGLFLGVSMMWHGKNVLDNDETYKQLYEFERDQKVKPARDRMMESYNSQMVPMLEREVRELKEEVGFQKLMKRTNRTLYESCILGK